MNAYDYLWSDADDGASYWRSLLPDVVEDYLDDPPTLRELVPDLPAALDVDIDFDPAELADVPAEVLETAIRTVGETMQIPGDALEDLLDEAGDTRDGMLGLFEAMVEEAGSTARDASENAIWAFFTTNAVLGAVVLGGLALVGGGAFLLSGGKLEVAKLLAEAGLKVGKGR